MRWGRAVHHNQARHGPYRAGIATPKVWFNQTQQFFKCTFAPARLLLPALPAADGRVRGDRAGRHPHLHRWLRGSPRWSSCSSRPCSRPAIRQLPPLRVGRPVALLARVLLVVFATEAWISLPGRPVGLHGTRPAVITQAVIH